MDDIIPVFIFTPRERELEYKSMEETKKLINASDFSEKEKEFLQNIWIDYFIEYENEYNQHNKIIQN
jgi:hypothetical protein